MIGKGELILKEIHLASTQGFCAGVASAIDVVDLALEKYGKPLYVRHHIVHNTAVIEDFEEKGVVFIEELSDVPEGQTVIFSAHGTAPEEFLNAKERGLKIIDATCPLVTKVHLEVIKFSQAGRECILIGHQFHPEVEGTMGQYDDIQGGKIYLVESVQDVSKLEVQNPAQLSYVTQTTLSMDDTAKVINALRQKFPSIEGPRKKDICYATQNRQDAVKQLALECDLLLVVGSPNSSNSNRLKELAERLGCSSYLIDNVDDINPGWFAGKLRFGITAGASAPEVLVQQVVAHLQKMSHIEPQELIGVEENIIFSMPKELRIKI